MLFVGVASRHRKLCISAVCYMNWNDSSCLGYSSMRINTAFTLIELVGLMVSGGINFCVFNYRN